MPQHNIDFGSMFQPETPQGAAPGIGTVLAPPDAGPPKDPSDKKKETQWSDAFVALASMLAGQATPPGAPYNGRGYQYTQQQPIAQGPRAAPATQPATLASLLG